MEQSSSIKVVCSKGIEPNSHNTVVHNVEEIPCSATKINPVERFSLVKDFYQVGRLYSDVEPYLIHGCNENVVMETYL